MPSRRVGTIMKAGDNAPAISAIVISYNHRPYIRDCVESVLSQTLTESWEIILADDSSTDGTADYLATLADSNARVRLIPSAGNMGAQANLRRALRSARGEFIALVEGDDYWLSDTKLSQQLAHLRKYADVAAVGHLTQVQTVDDLSPYMGDFDKKSHLCLDSVVLGEFPHFSSLFYRRSRLPTTPQWFDGLRAADWPMCCLLAAHGGIDLLRSVMSVYRVNPDSSWRPLPFVERRLDHLRQLRALDLNSHVITQPVRRRAYERSYKPVFSGLVRTRPLSEAFRLGNSALRIAPSQAARVFPKWAFEQVKYGTRQ